MTAAQGRECDHNRALLPGTTKKPTDPVLLSGPCDEDGEDEAREGFYTAMEILDA